MAVQTTQEKSPGTAEKMNATGQPTTAVEKKPSTDAKAAARQPAFATAMNAAVPSALAGTASQPAKPAAPAHEPSADHAADAAPEAPAETSTPALASAAPIAPTAPAASGAAAPSAKPQVRTPATDPRFQKVMHRLDQSAAKTKKHPPTKKKVAETHAAAMPPANEKLAGAQANQVDAMQSAKGKKVEDNSFLTLLRAEIARIMPQTLGDTEDFMKGDQPQKLKGAMTGNVNQQKEDASGEIKAASNQAPDPGKVEGKTVTPLPEEGAPPTPPAVGAAESVPEPKPEGEVSLQQSKQDTDQQLKDAEMTPGQLQEANDPRFSAVLTAKSDVAKQADSAPKEFRSTEQKTLTQEAAKAEGDEEHGLTAMRHEKGKAGSAVKLKQLSAKEKDEARRKEVTDHIEKIYSETKQAVENKLTSMENDVSSMFDKGIEGAMTNMKSYIDQKMNAYKDDRYGDLGGGLLWAKDKLFGLPDEVKVFYEKGRELFMRDLDTLVVKIATVVETRLKEAKDEIAKGQARISDYVKSLPKDLQAVGKAAEKEVAGRFEELSKGVDEKKNALAQKLAQRYKEANDKANEQLKKMQEENKGLVTKFVEKLGEIIKILREFKERISSMFKEGKDTIMLIVAHPIRFLGYLIDAVKQGVNQFVDNIWTHLKAGFMAWLFGTLENAGIQIPKDFSLGSILKLVLQILGLTYERIRAKAVKLIGERNVEVIEKVGKFLYTLITSGPEALWEQIKEFLGNLKEMVVDAIQNWIVTTVIKAAVIKLLSLFNPAGAIIQAIQLIYNTVMFFIERIDQILSFVESIINSVHKIAVGDIGDAANWIEKALARTIPIIIGFLARLLGLGNISEEIQKIIHKIQDFIDKALDKLIDKVVKGIGKLFGKGKDEKPDERTPEQKQKDLDKAIEEADSLLDDKNASEDEIKKKLSAIKTKYKMTSLELVIDGKSEDKETVHIEGEINPKKRGKEAEVRIGDYYAEENLIGSGKHGLHWTEGPSRANKESIPQGKFGSKEDIEFAVKKGSEIGKNKEDTFPLPKNNLSIVYLPIGGNPIPATRVFVKVYNDGKVHAIPKPDEAVITMLEERYDALAAGNHQKVDELDAKLQSLPRVKA